MTNAHRQLSEDDRLQWRARAVAALVDIGSPRNRGRVIRWFAAGLAFMGVSTAFLYLFVDVLGLNVPIGTFLTAEVCTLLRFLVNHYWVFGARSPTLRQCVQYHLAVAVAFTVWWVAANVLTWAGVHYLIAGIAAVGVSTLFSISSNFLWVWRRQH